MDSSGHVIKGIAPMCLYLLFLVFMCILCLLSTFFALQY